MDFGISKLEDCDQCFTTPVREIPTRSVRRALFQTPTQDQGASLSNQEVRVASLMDSSSQPNEQSKQEDFAPLSDQPNRPSQDSMVGEVTPYQPRQASQMLDREPISTLDSPGTVITDPKEVFSRRTQSGKVSVDTIFDATIKPENNKPMELDELSKMVETNEETLKKRLLELSQIKNERQ